MQFITKGKSSQVPFRTVFSFGNPPPPISTELQGPQDLAKLPPAEPAAGASDLSVREASFKMTDDELALLQFRHQEHATRQALQALFESGELAFLADHPFL